MEEAEILCKENVAEAEKLRAKVNSLEKSFSTASLESQSSSSQQPSSESPPKETQILSDKISNGNDDIYIFLIYVLEMCPIFFPMLIVKANSNFKLQFSV